MSSTQRLQELIPLLSRGYVGYDGRLGRIANTYTDLESGFFEIDTFPMWETTLGHLGKKNVDVAPGLTLESVIQPIQTLIEAKEYVLKETDEVGRSPLHLIFTLHSPGQIDVVRMMLSAKSANVNVRDKWKRTPLHHLLSRFFPQNNQKGNEGQSVALIRLLLDCGANVNAQDHQLVTPLHLAVRYSQLQSVELIQLLLDCGANVNAQDDQLVSPLHLAVQYSQLQSVRTLIEHGADCSATDEGGRSALHIASGCFPLKDQREVLQILIENGTNVNATDLGMKTPLYYFLESRLTCDDAACPLLRAGANLNLANEPESPLLLHTACQEGRPQVARWMLCLGANPNKVDSYGNTALHLAAKSSCMPRANTCVQILIDAGFDLAAKCEYGYTPLMMMHLRSPYKLIIAHVVLQVTEGNYFLSEMEQEHLNSKRRFSKLYENCCSCVSAMRAQTLGGSSITLWGFLLATQREARQYTRNPRILKDLRISKNSRTFRPFSPVIAERIGDCIYFHRLHQQAFPIVQTLFPNLPALVIESIVSHLNDVDLETMILAAQQTKQ